MKLTFVQTPEFARQAKRLGIPDQDVQALESLVMSEPDAGAVIVGTGGVRKIRFAPPSWHTGKSGAARVLYAYLQVAEHVYFLTVFSKNEKENIAPAEKAVLKHLMDRIKSYHDPQS